MNEALLRAAVSVLMGAAAGGLTNTLAIWMLFHPLRPVKGGGDGESASCTERFPRTRSA